MSNVTRVRSAIHAANAPYRIAHNSVAYHSCPQMRGFIKKPISGIDMSPHGDGHFKLRGRARQLLLWCLSAIADPLSSFGSRAVQVGAADTTPVASEDHTGGSDHEFMRYFQEEPNSSGGSKNNNSSSGSGSEHRVVLLDPAPREEQDARTTAGIASVLVAFKSMIRVGRALSLIVESSEASSRSTSRFSKSRASTPIATPRCPSEGAKGGGSGDDDEQRHDEEKAREDVDGLDEGYRVMRMHHLVGVSSTMISPRSGGQIQPSPRSSPLASMSANRGEGGLSARGSPVPSSNVGTSGQQSPSGRQAVDDRGGPHQEDHAMV